MKRKKTKKALSGSVLALVLCFVMLIGTTFAWFTSSDSTAVNKIEAGTLDVDLMMKDANDSWVSATNQTLNFAKATDSTGQDILWEPGATYTLPAIKVVNKGNLALKYRVVLTAMSGDTKLAEVLDVTLKDGNDSETCGTLASLLGKTDGIVATDRKLGANKSSNELIISVKMQDTAGNAYQGLSIDGIAVTVYATQDTVEYDSTTNLYDQYATYPDADATKVATAADLANAIANGGSIVLTDDITLDNSVTVTRDVTIYGNGNTITTTTSDRIFHVGGSETTYATDDINIELYNVTLDASNATGYGRAISCHYNNGKVSVFVDNCTLKAKNYAINVGLGNSDITVNVRNSDITGYAAVQTYSANSKLNFTNCTLNGVNTYSGESNVFGTVVVSAGATGSVFNFNDCTITATHTDAMHYLFDVLDNATINATNCTLTSNDTTVTADNYTSYCYTAGGVTANITIS